jgi:hypothetical protein
LKDPHEELADLLTEFRVAGKRLHFAGGLLGHWAVWTKRAVELLAERLAEEGEVIEEAPPLQFSASSKSRRSGTTWFQQADGSWSHRAPMSRADLSARHSGFFASAPASTSAFFKQPIP